MQSDSDASRGGGGKRRGKRSKALGDFTHADIKRFVRSVRKFARPVER